MRDKKDNATIDLPGFEPAEPIEATQEQLVLLDLAQTDDTGLPVWTRDPNLDLTGLPIWQPAD